MVVRLWCVEAYNKRKLLVSGKTRYVFAAM